MDDLTKNESGGDTGPKKVVAFRLPGWKLFALDQLAALVGESRTDMLSRCIAEEMRRVMREHPEWPLDPVSLDRACDDYLISAFGQWSAMVVSENPANYLSPFTRDGAVTGYWFKSAPDAPKLRMTAWAKNVARYHARKLLEKNHDAE